MSRLLKRVPLDFDWPKNKVWEGYINPHSDKAVDCTACDRTGYAPQAKLFSDQWYGNAPFDPKAYGAKPLTVDHAAIQAYARRQCERTPEFYVRHLSLETAIQKEARRLHELWKNQWSHHLIQADVEALVKDERLWDFTREPRTEEQREIVKKKIAAGGNSWLPENNGYMPTADEVNNWSILSMGHDSINHWVCVNARCKREGVPSKCPACKGHGHTWPSKEIKKLHDKWKDFEPPNGEGFQLWEDVSEGSPISPVFKTLDELCAWCEPNATTFGSNKTTAAKWKEMLDANFVCHKEGNAVFM